MNKDNIQELKLDNKVVCIDCGVKYLTANQKIRAAVCTFHEGECCVCGKIKSVKIVAFAWFLHLPYSKQVEYCEQYFNERSPDALTEEDVECIYRWEVTDKDGIIPLAELTPVADYNINNSILDREVFNKEDMRKCYEAGIKMGESYITNHGYDNYIDFETYLNNIAR